MLRVYAGSKTDLIPWLSDAFSAQSNIWNTQISTQDTIDQGQPQKKYVYLIHVYFSYTHEGTTPRYSCCCTSSKHTRVDCGMINTR